jgi:cytochrome c
VVVAAGYLPGHVLNIREAHMSSRTLLAVLVGLSMTASSAYAAGDAEAGKQVFKQCALCHTAEAGKNKIGPSLFGVVGRQAGSVSNFNYSDAMKNFKKTWTPEELNTYLTNPRQVVQGTKMIFAGLKDEKQRADVVAYLESLK